MAKGVTPASAQHLAVRQHTQQRLQPAAQAQFARCLAAVAARQQGRCHVKFQCQGLAGLGAFKLLLQGLAELPVGVQAGHFVLVFVAHQPQQAAGHGACQGQAGVAAELALGVGHALHGRAVARRPGGVLVGTQVRHATRQQRVEVVGLSGCRRRFAGQQLLAGLRIGRRQAPQREGQQVAGHGHIVQLNRSAQCGQAHRHQATLPGVAQRDDVGRDAIAQKGLGQGLGVEGVNLLGPGGVAQLVQQQRHLQVGIGVAQDLGHRDFVRVHQHLGAAMAHGVQGIGAGTDHDVAGQQGVGLLGVDAHLVQALRAVGQAHKAQH